LNHVRRRPVDYATARAPARRGPGRRRCVRLPRRADGAPRDRVRCRASRAGGRSSPTIRPRSTSPGSERGSSSSRRPPKRAPRPPRRLTARRTPTTPAGHRGRVHRGPDQRRPPGDHDHPVDRSVSPVAIATSVFVLAVAAVAGAAVHGGDHVAAGAVTRETCPRRCPAGSGRGSRRDSPAW
jgi:hypothetical protein